MSEGERRQSGNPVSFVTAFTKEKTESPYFDNGDLQRTQQQQNVLLMASLVMNLKRYSLKSATPEQTRPVAKFNVPEQQGKEEIKLSLADELTVATGCMTKATL